MLTNEDLDKVRRIVREELATAIAGSAAPAATELLRAIVGSLADRVAARASSSAWAAEKERAAS